MAALFITVGISVSVHMSINRGADGQWDTPIRHYYHPVLILVRGLTFRHTLQAQIKLEPSCQWEGAVPIRTPSESACMKCPILDNGQIQ